MCVGVLPACLCATCTQCLQKPEGNIRTSGTRAKDFWVLGLEPRSYEKSRQYS